MIEQLTLRYGCNPQQVPAVAKMDEGVLPFQLLNGKPSLINLLDALNGWQLVKELREGVGLPAAASFKHVSPAGVAVGVPFSDPIAQAYFVDGAVLSPLATAYARARGADRVSSFGDFVALSDVVDVPTARLLRQEVSDGIIAPGYEPEALALLKQKRKGSYCIFQIEADFEPPMMEMRQVFGVSFEQRRNDAFFTRADLNQIVTVNRALPEAAQRDMLVALVALKYTQSNSVCFAYDGQVIGMGAGQQSRIHCTRLAGQKADNWYLRQHPLVLGLPFVDGLPRPFRDNAIDQYLLPHLSDRERADWLKNFTTAPPPFTAVQKRDWLAGLTAVTLASDAFIPFRDNIDRAAQSGVQYVVQPGGSLRDDGVISACDAYDMVMVFTDTRLFHH